MNRALIIGGTGNVGRHVVSQLAAIGAHVRVMTRKPDAVRLPARIEVAGGDLTAPETLDRCLDGIDSVFLVWTALPDTVHRALERVASRTRRIVFLSAPLKTAHPFFQQPNSASDLAARIEAFIENSGVEWTFLRPGMFAGNSRHFWGPQIRSGDGVRWPYLAAATAPIDERDIAAIAVRALVERGHAGMEYILTGPQSLSQYEQIATIGRVVGRSLRIDEIPPEEARGQLATTMSAPVAMMLLNAWAATLGHTALVTSTYQEITGTPARSFLDWAADHREDFRE